jgi:hypothetical protein
LALKSLETTYMPQPNRFRFENFYHRTEMPCSVHRERNILGKSSHWAKKGTSVWLINSELKEPIRTKYLCL